MEDIEPQKPSPKDKLTRVLTVGLQTVQKYESLALTPLTR
jgi:hypothetical protein